MDLGGRHILITSGPTHSPIDAVRYIGNRSSGRLGCAMATAALDAGAHVTMVAGPGSVVLGPRDGLHIARIATVEDLIRTLEDILTAGEVPDAVLHAMAVLDYVPAEPSSEKTPSGKDAWTVRLVRTPKVIRLIRDWAPDALLVQFKLEVGCTDGELASAATDSMRGNRSDMVVANDIARIRDDVHPALIIGADGDVLARAGTKGEIAERLCAILAQRLSS